MKPFRQQHNMSPRPVDVELHCQEFARHKRGSRWHFFIGLPCSLVCLLFLLIPSSGLASCRARSSSEESAATELQTQRVARLADTLLAALLAQDCGEHCCHGRSAQAHSLYIGDSSGLRKKSPLRRLDHTRGGKFLLQSLSRLSWRPSPDHYQPKSVRAVTSCKTLSGRAIVTFVAPKLGPPLR